tara:strand:+ start:523 stop:945 length:423 start_codon:yes stop_codon:yes gene_type:complete
MDFVQSNLGQFLIVVVIGIVILKLFGYFPDDLSKMLITPIVNIDPERGTDPLDQNFEKPYPISNDLIGSGRGDKCSGRNNWKTLVGLTNGLPSFQNIESINTTLGHATPLLEGHKDMPVVSGAGGEQYIRKKGCDVILAE